MGIARLAGEEKAARGVHRVGLCGYVFQQVAPRVDVVALNTGQRKQGVEHVPVAGRLGQLLAAAQLRAPDHKRHLPHQVAAAGLGVHAEGPHIVVTGGGNQGGVFQRAALHLLHEGAQQIVRIAVGVEIGHQSGFAGFALPLGHVQGHFLIICGQIVRGVVGGSEHKHKQGPVFGLRGHALFKVAVNIAIPHAPEPDGCIRVIGLEVVGVNDFVKTLHLEHPVQVAPAGAG